MKFPNGSFHAVSTVPDIWRFYRIANDHFHVKRRMGWILVMPTHWDAVLNFPTHSYTDFQHMCDMMESDQTPAELKLAFMKEFV